MNDKAVSFSTIIDSLTSSKYRVGAGTYHRWVKKKKKTETELFE